MAKRMTVGIQGGVIVMTWVMLITIGNIDAKTAQITIKAATTTPTTSATSATSGIRRIAIKWRIFRIRRTRGEDTEQHTGIQKGVPLLRMDQKSIGTLAIGSNQCSILNRRRRSRKLLVEFPWT
jgi:hypothetical protein